MSTSQYVVACSVLIGLAVTGWWCWSQTRQQLEGKGGKRRGGDDDEDEDDKETKPLIQRGKKGKAVSKTIAIFENQSNAVNNNNNNHNKRKNNNKVAPAAVERCAACRKVLLVSTTTTTTKKKKNGPPKKKDQQQQQQLAIIRFRDQQLHKNCFRCNDCQQLLENHSNETIQVYKANGRYNYQCQNCCCNKVRAVVVKPSREAGVAITIEDHEQGNTQQTLKDIGDDLNEAMYFSHPKCCVCGGNFNEKTKVIADYQRGNWKYHRDCYYDYEQDNNNNNNNNNVNNNKPITEIEPDAKTQKLSPAHSAKYLPDQLVLQLLSSSSSSSNLEEDDNNIIILTTLYFVWKDRDNQSVKLRKEKSNNDSSTVTIPFTLDEEAPANPNYVHQAGPELFSEGMQKHKHKKQRLQQRRQQPRTVKILELPTTPLEIQSFVEGCQLRLMAWEQVAPLYPRMVEPGAIIIVHTPSRCEEETNTITTTKSLMMRLQYMKFGLWYELILTIPFVMGEEDVDSEAKEKKNQLNLEDAKLAITIREGTPSKSKTQQQQQQQQTAAMGTEEQ